MIKLILTLVAVMLGFLSIWITDERGWRYVVLVEFGIVVLKGRHHSLEQTGKEFDRVQKLIDEHKSKWGK